MPETRLIEILSRRWPGFGFTVTQSVPDNKAPGGRRELTPAEQYATLTRDDEQALPKLAEIMTFEAEVNAELVAEAAEADRNAELDKAFITFRFLDDLSSELEALRRSAGVEGDGVRGFAKHDFLRAQLAQIRQL